MTTKDFFLKTLKDEAPRFRKAIDALPEEQYNHKVHEKSREAGNIAAQLALQWKGVSGIINKGAPDFNMDEMNNLSKTDVLNKFDLGLVQLQKDVEEISLEDWENGDASMGPTWSAKKYDMAWGFLFDAIHHRGQLSTFLREMGVSVPSIYGPSADAQN